MITLNTFSSHYRNGASNHRAARIYAGAALHAFVKWLRKLSADKCPNHVWGKPQIYWLADMTKLGRRLRCPSLMQSAVTVSGKFSLPHN